MSEKSPYREVDISATARPRMNRREIRPDFPTQKQVYRIGKKGARKSFTADKPGRAWVAFKRKPRPIE